MGVGGMGSVGFSGPNGTMIVPEVISTRTGPLPHGLIVRLKTDHSESEIVSLSTAPLDESLFTPPPGFREVLLPTPSPPPLSFTDQLTFEWLTFRNWLNTLFGS